MFILKNEFDLPQKFRYFLYTHGPYSAVLQSEIDKLTTFRLIEENVSYVIQYLRYEYSLTEQGEAMAKSIMETLSPSAIETLDKIGERAIQLNQMDLNSLVDEAYKYVKPGKL